MPLHILVIVSCHLAYFQYPGYRHYYVGSFCQAAAPAPRRPSWKETMRAGLRRRAPRPLTYYRPRPTWAREHGGKTGWKR